MLLVIIPNYNIKLAKSRIGYALTLNRHRSTNIHWMKLLNVNHFVAPTSEKLWLPLFKL